MAVIKKEVDIAKEADDVLGLVVHIVKELKGGADVSAVLASSTPKLIDAISGIDQVSGEISDSPEALYNAVSLRTSEIVAIFLKKDEVQTVEA